MLESLDIISEDEKIEQYLVKLKNSVNSNVSECKTTILEQLYDFYQNNKSNGNVSLAKSINDYMQYDSLSRSATVPSYANYSVEGTIIVQNFYKIHYENDPTRDNYINATELNQIKSELSNMYTYYYTTNSFTKPDKESGETYYHIYLVPSGGNAAQKLSTGSYIYITVDKSTSIDSELFKTFAHEIFHTIMYKYNSHQKPDPWFSEAFASFAGVSYANYQLSQQFSWATLKVKHYFDSIETSLDERASSASSRNYGQLVLPKYIYEKMGGMATIKSILNKLTAYTNSIDAIDAGLKAVNSSYSFKEAFVACSSFNVKPASYYEYASGWTGVNITRNNTNYSKNYVYPNAAKYFNYTATSSTSSQLAITVNSLSNPNYLKLRIMRHKGNGGSAIYNVTDFSASATSKTITIPDYKTGTASTIYNKVTVITTNANTASSGNVTFSISGTKS